LDRALKEQAAKLPDAIDQAVVTTNLGVDDRHSWWSVVRALQWAIFAITAVGLIWLLVNVVLTGILGLPAMPLLRTGGLPLPTWLLICGAASGIVLAGVSRIALTARAGAAGAKAMRRLRRAMERVAATQVIIPINDELKRYTAVQQNLKQIVE
jgi:hypothetical protein